MPSHRFSGCLAGRAANDYLQVLLQLVYKHLEEQAAAEETGTSAVAAEEECLLHGGDQDYPQQLSYAVDNLHESSVISICCWPGSSDRVFTGSGAVSTSTSNNFVYSEYVSKQLHMSAVRLIQAGLVYIDQYARPYCSMYMYGLIHLCVPVAHR